MPQRCKPCQEKAVEQTFVVDCSRLLSFAVGYISDYQNILFSWFITRILEDILQIILIHELWKVEIVMSGGI